MSFREWLTQELINDEIIADDSIEADGCYTIDDLYACTELDEDMYEQYRREFEEHCASIEQTPIWDVD